MKIYIFATHISTRLYGKISFSFNKLSKFSKKFRMPKSRYQNYFTRIAIQASVFCPNNCRIRLVTSDNRWNVKIGSKFSFNFDESFVVVMLRKKIREKLKENFPQVFSFKEENRSVLWRPTLIFLSFKAPLYPLSDKKLCSLSFLRWNAIKA